MSQDGRLLVARPLTAAAFSPYGDVITGADTGGRAINAGTSRRIEMPDPDLLDQDGRPSLSVFRAQAPTLPLDLVVLERHRHGSQTFLPLGAVGYIVVVALGDAAPDLATLAAFDADGRTGITLRRGVWHHPLIALANGDFAVLERRGAEVDCDLVALAGGWSLVAGH